MKNIIKSFFLVAMTALMLFSCTNVNDPTAVLESNGVVTTNKLVGLEIKKLPEALKGKELSYFQTNTLNNDFASGVTVTSTYLMPALAAAAKDYSAAMK